MVRFVNGSADQLGVIALIAGVGAYFGAYLKQKGKDLATHEDINQLVEQMRAVTLATKENRS